jgi:pyruvate dehydrogenase E2 component (dihydrolipoamide acetyltransferase)
MPQLSPTMEVGAVTKWLVKEGDPVTTGDIIAEIETDKATMEMEAADDGTLGKILAPEGTEDIPVHQPIAVMLQEGEEASALKDFEPEGEAPRGDGAGEAAAQPKPAQAAARPEQPAEAAAKPTATPTPRAAPTPRTAAPASPRADGERLFASPLARRVAAEQGLDLGAIAGSGPHGRIVLRDVEGAAQTGAAKAAPTREAKPAAAKPEAARPAVAAAAPGGTGGPAKPEDLGYPEGSYEVMAIDSMRRTVARRMAESMRTIPHYYETIDCRIDALVALRKDLNTRSKDYRLSVNDFVIRAAALALKRVPEVNSSWSETGILRHRHADVAMAVALESGLITPVIREADNLGLAEISRQARDLAKRARDRKLKPEEYQGGTFTISNLGMFSIREFTAVINPPQAAILAIGRAEPRPIVKEGAVAIATMMTCTLSSDHRLIDGAVAARFLDVFQRLVEDPVTMLL